MNKPSARSLRRLILASVFAAGPGCLCITAGAQLAPEVVQEPSPAMPTASVHQPGDTLTNSDYAAGTSPSPAEAALLLPDAPGTGRDSSSSATAGAQGPSASGSGKALPASSMPEASHTAQFIDVGQAAPDLSAGDKILLGLRDSVSPSAALGWLASAGYAQVLNGSPNYGTDRGAFGERLGAGAIRDISEDVFSESFMSVVLREDPRYYRLGPSHNFFVRLVYAGTRTIVTRTDSGRLSPNLALLSGTLGGAALTNFYYPPINHGATQTMETYGGSLGGTALGNVVSEFYGDFVHLFHPDRH